MTRTFGDFTNRWRDLNRTAKRQRQVRHLILCGVRPVLEALLAVDAGQDLDVVLEEFCRLHPETCKAVAADELPFDRVGVIDGARR